MNDAIWSIIFEAFSLISDNAYIITGIASMAFSTIMFFVFRDHSYLLVFTGIGYTVSISSALDSLMVIHSRLNSALEVTSDIILGSESYLDNLTAQIGFLPNKDELKEILYSLEYKSNLQELQPKDLYYHFYNTMDQIRTNKLLGYIDDQFCQINMIAICIIFLLCIISLISLLKKQKSFVVYGYVTLLTISFFLKTGVFINILIYCSLSSFYMLTHQLCQESSDLSKIHPFFL